MTHDTADIIANSRCRPALQSGPSRRKSRTDPSEGGPRCGTCAIRLSWSHLAAQVVALAAAGLAPEIALGAEGASSHYLPGTPGEFGFALPPQPGLTAAIVVWVQSGDVGAAVLQGEAQLDLDLTVVLDLMAVTYALEKPVLGGTFSSSAVVPFGYAELDATLAGPAGQALRASADSFALSDAAITPAQLNWSRGNFYLKLAETIIAPTGAYDLDATVNLGRNYWSFDTIAAVTWFNPDLGSEVSIAPGIMINTENTATDYRTGTEFHLDFAANQFLSPTFFMGPRGYWYQQITDDSGAGAILGDFRSSSFGLGVGIGWTPAFAEGRLSLAAKWMSDIEAENRFDSDYAQFSLSWTF